MKTDFLTHKERYKFLRRIHCAYQKANKKRKGEILDFYRFCQLDCEN